MNENAFLAYLFHFNFDFFGGCYIYDHLSIFYKEGNLGPGKYKEVTCPQINQWQKQHKNPGFKIYY